MPWGDCKSGATNSGVIAPVAVSPAVSKAMLIINHMNRSWDGLHVSCPCLQLFHWSFSGSSAEGKKLGISCYVYNTNPRPLSVVIRSCSLSPCQLWN